MNSSVWYDSPLVQEENCVFELTYNWGVDEPYDKGNAYAQVRLPVITRSLEFSLSNPRPNTSEFLYLQANVW